MTQPLVTLGMPVYNEAAYIRGALDALLQQTYPHIEIIIADNASTDGTSEIIEEYCKKYPQIRHVRHERNLGQHTNFNCLPALARGTYFAWVSGHDSWDQHFFEAGVRVLNQKSECVLAFPRTIDVTYDNKVIREHHRPFDIERMSQSRRFREVMWRVDCNIVYGVWRLAPMLDTRIFQAIPAPDRVFLAEMALKGTFAPMDAVKYARMNRPIKQNELQKRQRLMAYIHPDRTFTDTELMRNDIYRPTQDAFYRAIWESKMSPAQQVITYASTWAAGVMKMHLFPGADLMSTVVKTLLPRRILEAILRQMQ